MTMTIEYPYLPEGRMIQYVSSLNVYIVAAKEFARRNSLDNTMPGASVVVNKNGKIIGYAANGSDYHKNNPCQRVILGCKTGQGYELCEGCHPKNHSEPKAMVDAIRKGHATRDADLYLWGHWWCCEPCWESMIVAEIRQVYLLKGSETLFNREHPENIIGRQFL